MKITMSYLVSETGYSRQWLSKFAENGEIPGAVRRQSGRWSFPEDNPEFQTWLENMKRWNRKRHSKWLYRDEQAVKILRKRRAEEWRKFGLPTKDFKARMDALAEAITVASSKVTDYVSCHDIAREIGRSKRWVTKLSHNIPGVTVFKNRIVFKKSGELADWVMREYYAVKAERTKLRRPPRSWQWRTPASALTWETHQLCMFASLKLRQHPFADWTQEDREIMQQQVELLLNIFRSNGLTAAKADN